MQFCRCCWIYYQQLSGCFIQFILSLQIQHPSPPYGASYISSQCYKIFFYHIDLQVVKMRYRLNSEMFELQIGEPPLGAVPDKITYMENMILFTIQNTFACAGILQEGDETEGIYCRASYIYLYSCGSMVCFVNQKMKMTSTDCSSVDKLLPSSFCSVQNLKLLK